MEESKKSNKKVLIGVVALVLVAAVLCAVYFLARPQATAGAKNVTIEVVNGAGESTVYDVKTDAEFLHGAMDDANGLTYEITDGMVMTVNGETHNWSEDGTYWAIFVNGDYGQFGVDEQVVTDGDAYSFQAN